MKRDWCTDQHPLYFDSNDEGVRNRSLSRKKGSSPEVLHPAPIRACLLPRPTLSGGFFGLDLHSTTYSHSFLEKYNKDLDVRLIKSVRQIVQP